MPEYNLIKDILAQLPAGDVPEHEPKDLVGFLTEKYGNPEIVLTTSGVEKLIFSLPDNRLALFRDCKTRILSGFIVLAQVAPIPCPNPRVLGAIILTASGPNLAELMIDLMQSYSAVSRTFCVMCKPPCNCDIVATAGPSISKSFKIKWKWFIPRIVVTISISLPIRASCV